MVSKPSCFVGFTIFLLLVAVVVAAITGTTTWQGPKIHTETSVSVEH
jgi:hypothetical protein